MARHCDVTIKEIGPKVSCHCILHHDVGCNMYFGAEVRFRMSKTRATRKSERKKGINTYVAFIQGATKTKKVHGMWLSR